MLRRLYGKVVVQINEPPTQAQEDSLILLEEIPGKLRVCCYDRFVGDREFFYKYQELVKAMAYSVRKRVLYCFAQGIPVWHFPQFPNLIFQHNWSHVYHRPSLLNGRHVVDLLRVVCGAADVEDMELNRARRQATAEAWDVPEIYGEEYEGVRRAPARAEELTLMCRQQ